MNRSDSIGELAAALVLTQKAVKKALKDADNPYFKSKYADLESVTDACREALTANDLAVSQVFAPEDVPGTVSVETVLMHKSGQFISGTLTMTAVKTDPQAVGSAITYARRYSLAAIVGVVTEDDDAEGAMKRAVPSLVSKDKLEDIESKFLASESAGDLENTSKMVTAIKDKLSQQELNHFASLYAATAKRLGVEPKKKGAAKNA
ncbi:MAG TPA: ERF family protein [Bryobacteraceae bacterium]|jgi:hypothetical protein